jgi:RND family efflux transporter MFP subunit
MVLPDVSNEVKVLELEEIDFEQELISNGVISANRKADLKFQTEENITAIYVKNGDRVVKGQKLASLDQFKLRNSYEQALDNLERAKLELQDVLIGQGYALADTLKVSAEMMKIAKVKSNYDQTRILCDLAEYNLKHSVLYAPFNGIVANLFTKENNVPSGQDAFCTIIDNSNPEIIFSVLENELPIITIGDKVTISPFAMNNYTVTGRISEINPSVDKNGLIRVKASVNNQQNKLFDGMNVKVSVQRTLPGQLVIPKTALVLRSNKKVVFTLKNGKAQWIYVQTGMENSSGYVVTDGLVKGDSVIYDGNINLAHESPVVLK